MTQQLATRRTAGSAVGRATGFELQEATSRPRPTSSPRSRATAPSPPRRAPGRRRLPLPAPLRDHVASIRASTQCGSGALADDAFPRRYAQRIGAKESALLERRNPRPRGRDHRRVKRLRSAPAVSPRVTVTGHVYDLVTGLLQTSLPAAVTQIEALPNPNPKETKHHENRGCP